MRIFYKLLPLFLSMLLLIGMVAGCGNFERKSIDTHSGFGYMIRSKRTSLNINDVTMDFYYAFLGGQGSVKSQKGLIHDGGIGNYELICYVLYFYEGQYHSQTTFYGPSEEGYNVFGDYRNVDNYFFVRELPGDEMNSGKYSGFLEFPSCEYSINHYESLTVPKEVFERKAGTFVFSVAGINYSKRDDGYCINRIGYIHLNYEYLDEHTILLLKPRDPLPY